MGISVIVPAYNAGATLPDLLESLLHQNHKGFETIVVDDCSEDATAQIAQSYGCHLVRLEENHGPAYCRNTGARRARGDIIVFTDSDCRVDGSWIEHIRRHFRSNDADAIMGRLVLMPSTYLGDSISALGFPAGGSIGFEKIWKVDRSGLTRSLSSCNCAIRKDVFWNVGGFDESFPFAGGEDTLLAHNLITRHYRIRYCPDVVAFHKARESMSDFVRWQFRRGVSSYIFSKKIRNKVGFGALRIWSTANIITHFCRDRKFPLILFLLVTGFVAQLSGFLSASICYKSTFQNTG